MSIIAIKFYIKGGKANKIKELELRPIGGNTTKQELK
jgi:hypothetical protein